jgi:3-oxoacyl-[acyl-carrier protein] reductase
MKILVTGGASGLGKSITLKLAANKTYRLFFTYAGSSAEAAAINKEYDNTVSFKCDFRRSEDIQALLAKLDEWDVDVVVHNAFTGFEKKHFHRLAPEAFTDSFRNNVLPVIAITQKAIASFRKKRSGKIITILSSAIVNTPPSGWSEYTAAKAYLHSLSKSWAVENASFNITSNCISPSFMLTPLNSDTDERIVEEMIKQHPLKKLLTPEEVAESVCYLCTATQQINGINLLINSAESVI